MRISLVLCPLLVILCNHFNGATLFSLLGKKNYILAKPRIIIQPKIYIGTHPLLLKKKAVAAKAVAGVGLVSILKKLKPRISLPKLELPRLPKIPLSFSVSLDKPEPHLHDNEEEVEEAAEAAADAVRNAAEEEPHLHPPPPPRKSLSSLKDLSWLSDAPDGWSSFGDGYSVEESKSHRIDRLKHSKSSSTSSAHNQRKEQGFGRGSGSSNLNDDDVYSKYNKEKPIGRPSSVDHRRRRRPGKMEEQEDNEEEDER